MKGQSPSNIYKSMVVVAGDHTPTPTTVFEWAHCFKDEQSNIEDNPRCAQPITATHHQTVKVIEGLIIKDRRIAIQQIA